MPPISGNTGQQIATPVEVIKEVKDLQRVFYDRASNYTKIIMGIGYGGLLTIWSGTKERLSDPLVLWSALLLLVSLLAYVIFEVIQTGILSFLSIKFAQLDGNNLFDSIQQYGREEKKWMKPVMRAWFFVFPFCVLTGLAAAGILTYGFIRTLPSLAH